MLPGGVFSDVDPDISQFCLLNPTLNIPTILLVSHSVGSKHWSSGLEVGEGGWW